jgi:hypothetical protein
MTFRDYSVFGLRVRSEVELPELFEAEAGDPDVTIRRGQTGVPGKLERGLHQHDGALIFVEPEVGRYRITGGTDIVVEANPSVPERNVRLFLLGSAFGALLHQRGLLPLHANAVEIDGKAVAFMGESGAGKSTLAAWFHDRGHRVIADDVCVVRFGPDERAFAVPGLPRLRLWAQALEATGRSAADYARSYVGEVEYDKYDVPIGSTAPLAREVELAAVYLLAAAEAFSIEPLRGVAAVEAVFANTYRGAFISAADGHLSHWAASMRLVRTVPIFRLEREWDLGRLGQQSSRIVDEVRHHLSGSTIDG